MMPEWSLFIPSSAPLASMPSLSTPSIIFQPTGAHTVVKPAGNWGRHRPPSCGPAAKVHDGRHIVAGGGLGRFHVRDDGARQQCAGRFDAFALGGLHGDEPLERAGAQSRSATNSRIQL